jgi:hypothetical protein
VLDARGGLASALKNEGRLDEAEAEYRSILAALDGTTVCNPLDASFTKKNIALVILKRGDAAYGTPTVAQTFWEQSLAGLQAVRSELAETAGPDSRAILGSSADIAGVLWRLKRYDEAKREFDDVLPRMRAELGPLHWRYLEALAVSGRNLLSSGDTDGAIARLTEAMVGYINVRGIENSQTKLVVKLLDSAHGKAGNAAEKARLERLIAGATPQAQPAK